MAGVAGACRQAVHTVADQEAEEVEPNREPGSRDHI